MLDRTQGKVGEKVLNMKYNIDITKTVTYKIHVYKVHFDTCSVVLFCRNL